MALTKVHRRMLADSGVSVKDFGAVGDGIADDTSAIQAALDSGAAYVVFPQGNYLTSAALEPSDNQRLTGFGAVITCANQTFHHAILLNNVANVVIEYITIQGPAGGDGFDSAIRVIDCTNVTISNNTISNIGKQDAITERGFGVVLTGTNPTSPVVIGSNGNVGIKIIDNTITDIKGYGNVRGDAVYIQTTDGAIVSRNKMGLTRRMTVAVTDQATNLQIVDNEIYDCYLAGIDVEPNASPSASGKIVIANNTIRNFGIKPVGLTGTQYFGIDLHAALFEKVVVDGNIIVAEDAQAVSGINAMNNAKYAVISNNIIEGNGFLENGMKLYSGNGFESLVVTSNIIRGFTSFGIDGFQNQELTIDGNMFDAASCSAAIRVSTIQNACVVSNNAFDMGTCSDAVIFCTFGKKSVISGNVGVVASGDGIYVRSTSGVTAYAVVSSNSFEKSGATGNDAIKFEAITGATVSFITGGNLSVNFTNNLVNSGGTAVTGTWV